MKCLTSSQKKNQRLAALVTAIFVMLFSFKSQAVHLSTFRIYLDDDQRQVNFTVSNPKAVSQECKLSFRHYNYTDAGKLSEHEGEQLPDNSAKNWLRFSPKRFILTAANSQTVRFTMRRKAKAKAGEYRSFLEVDCGVEEGEGELNLINVQPILIHNVPIIVRVGKLKVDVNFRDVSIVDGAVNFALTRAGTRSIYGNVELIDTRTDKKIDYQNNFSIYPESSHTKFSLNTLGVAAKYLKLKFIENTNYGGDKVIEQDLEPKS